MTQKPKAQIMHYVCQIRKKAKPAHFPRYLRKNYVKLVTDVCHPGETRTENTIRLHYWSDKLRDTVHDICTKCHTSVSYTHLTLPTNREV